MEYFVLWKSSLLSKHELDICLPNSKCRRASAPSRRTSTTLNLKSEPRDGKHYLPDFKECPWPERRFSANACGRDISTELIGRWQRRRKVG
eukprot:5131478-Amphidinium_carterae.1